MLHENTNQLETAEQSNLSCGSRSLTINSPNSGSYDPRFGTLPIHTYIGLELAYVFFNRELFGGILPSCLITLQRSRASYGYFSGDRFVNVKNQTEVTDEISLNPMYFAERLPTNILSTLVHEMAHLWQHHFGRPSRGRYHNLQWAEKMHEIGLEPSDTGKPEGKKTGDSVSHYIVEGGRFDEACKEFLARNAALLYQDAAYRKNPTGENMGPTGEDMGGGDGEDAALTRGRKAASKTKYTCERNGLNAWAKPGVRLLCGYCGLEMKPV